MTFYARAKRGKKRQLNKKKVTTCIILVILIIAVFYLVMSNKILELKDNQSQEVTTHNVVANDITQDTKQQEEKTDEISNVVMPSQIGNYKVLGQLVIEKIGVEKYILDISESNSLKLSVAKLYGPSLNESGNFCISGHNWDNMLKRLSEMQVGDTFYMINQESKKKVNYEVYNTYTCVPEDLSCLDQNHDGKREVTLITCNPGGLTRFICKARETGRG